MVRVTGSNASPFGSTDVVNVSAVPVESVAEIGGFQSAGVTTSPS